jgi:predicted nucleic acid-binding protein
VVTPRKIEKVCRDSFDDHILAAAKTGHADYIVTADKDLLVLEKYKETSIITAAELRGLLEY